MKYLILVLLVLAPLGSPALRAGEKANTVLIHPGEVIYARFEQKGKKLKLISATKEKSDAAQVIVTLSLPDPKNKKGDLTLKVENNFAQDLAYEGEMRIVARNMRHPAMVSPVVGGRMALEPVPFFIDEIALFEFGLQL